MDLLAEAPLTFPSGSELKAFLKRRFLEDYPPEQLGTDLVFLHALDLAPPGLDLEAALQDFWLTWIGGYYNIVDGNVNIVVAAPKMAPQDSLDDSLSRSFMPTKSFTPFKTSTSTWNVSSTMPIRTVTAIAVWQYTRYSKAMPITS